MPAQTTIQVRRGTAASWTSTNPTLAAGEVGFETDTGRFKIGTGSTVWTGLGYATVLPSNFAAKGDLLVATGSGTFTNQAVGSNNQVLMADSTQADGVKYANEATATLTAKGDILTATAANTIARQAVGSNGFTLVADSSTSTGLAYSGTVLGNPVLNSAFQIWQRGTSFAGSTTAYTADRWQGYRGVAGSTFSRQVTGDTTNLPNIQYCMRVARDSGNTATNDLYLTQAFESVNSIPFAGRTVTFSFYARKGANLTNNPVATLYTGTGTDQNVLVGYTGVKTVIGQTIGTLTSTWQRYSYTATLDSNITEMQILFSYSPTGTAGAADYFEVTGVQIDLGSTALPFRTYANTIQGELAAAQRYYYRINAGTNLAYFGTGYAYSTGAADIQIPLPVQMRVTPTVIEYSALGDFKWEGSTSSNTPTAIAFDTNQNTKYAASVNVAKTSGFTAWQITNFMANGTTNAYLGFGAEL